MATYNDIQKREIFHFLFLEELLKISDPKLYVVKGGVNLRFFFRSPRYSEDMDIDVLGGNVATLKKNGYKILNGGPLRRSLKTFGIADLEVNDPAKAKHTETTQRFSLRLRTDPGELLPTKVEFSRRESKDQKYALETVDPDIAMPYQRRAFSCQHYTGESAAIQKVGALAGRTTPQARDVFDLGMLHWGGHFKRATIKGAIDKETIEKALESLDALRFEEFQGQVIEFLDDAGKREFGTAANWEHLKTTVLGVLRHDD